MRALTTRFTTARWAAALVWLLLGLSAAAWGWRVWGHVGFQALPLPAFELAQPDSGRVALALGRGATVTAEAPVVNRPSTPEVAIRLTGLARDSHGQGVALLAVSGQAAAPFRVGAMVTDDWQLVSLSPEGAELAHNSQPDLRRKIAFE